MSFGLAAFTIFHVALSLVGIAAGFVIVWGLLNAKRMDGWTLIYLVTTMATSVTGFMFPVDRLLPSHILGFISLVILAIAIVARYQRHLAGVWSRVYAVTAVLALYLNFFVLIVQSFLKIPVLHELAPTQAEPPFAIAQGIAFLAFAALTVAAAIKFRGDALGTT